MMSGDDVGRSDQMRKPDWLRIKLPAAGHYAHLKDHLHKHQLHTICESGNCPNLGECWTAGTATFMILGDICSRNCRFCAVNSGKPGPVDDQEPSRVAAAVKDLGLKHCVLTSVTRDDLGDGGAAIWSATVKAIRISCPGTTIETLIPDFNGSESSFKIMIAAAPDIISHNLETVRRLTPVIRSRAKYSLSLSVLEYLSKQGVTTKSGIMVGLGETDAEVYETMDDLLKAGCSIMTIGQYLQPSRSHAPVVRFVPPEQFDIYQQTAMKKGFKHAESKPLVRSSYHAEKHV
jgi:lipoyl synthase